VPIDGVTLSDGRGLVERAQSRLMVGSLAVSLAEHGAPLE
jgi:hypothetical protein